MQLALEHRWDLTPAEARELQTELAARIETADRLGAINTVAGVDCGFEDGGQVTRAAVSVHRFPSLEPVDSALARCPTRMPYVPGLLSFREVPAILEAVAQLQEIPDLLLCDGQGIAHPRRFGIACHLGLLLDRPAIGVGKSRLTGEHEEPGQERGNRSTLLHKEETIGTVLRTRDHVKPLFISPGHRIGLDSAVRFVLDCAPRFKLPEPIRAADSMASRRKD